MVQKPSVYIKKKRASHTRKAWAGASAQYDTVVFPDFRMTNFLSAKNSLSSAVPKPSQRQNVLPALVQSFKKQAQMVENAKKQRFLIYGRPPETSQNYSKNSPKPPNS